MAAIFPSLRSPQQIMRLERLGSLHASRLSFMRILLRRLQQQQWQFSRLHLQVNASGEGHAVYVAQGPQRSYSLVAFAHDLPEEKRSDRVIADAWDATFVLFDGIPNAADIQRLSKQVPLQEAGRITATELSLSRANRSERLWAQVVDCLAQGHQPSPELLQQSGYLMRTTAVYGSGKFGAADRHTIADRTEFTEPFQVEMLHVYLIRWFVRDLINQLARHQGGHQAVALAAPLARQLGIGNSTGLGMAPFLINHPHLLNNWMYTRELALVRILSIASVNATSRDLFLRLLLATQLTLTQWQSEHPLQQQKTALLKQDYAQLTAYLQAFNWQQAYPWQALWTWAETALAEDAQELLLSLMLEPYPDTVDELAGCMSVPEWQEGFENSLSVKHLRDNIETHCAWALALDWQDPTHTARLWYISAEKLEPRLGERAEEDLDEYEQPLCPGLTIAQLYQHSADFEDWTLAEYLFAHPQFRAVSKRVMRLDVYPYAEIQDNLLSHTMRPLDLLRCKLAFFGATQFDPRSDRWVRIVMFQHAPYPDELDEHNYDYWPYPAAGH